jgi:hypothetical protein
MQAYGACMHKARNEYSKCRMNCANQQRRDSSASRGASTASSTRDANDDYDASSENAEDSALNVESISAIVLGRREWNRVRFSSFM